MVDCPSNRLRHSCRVWLLSVTGVLILAGFTLVNCKSYLRSESEILSSSSIPSPAERGKRVCEGPVERSFDRSAVDAELDQMLGARVEKYERVHGPRIRIEGIAK